MDVDYLTIKNSAAYIDENGAVCIPLRGEALNKYERREHRKVCWRSLPCISLDAQGESIENRKLFAYCQPCCGQWFRPRYCNDEFSPDWHWVYVSRLRLWYWRKRGKI